MIPRRIHCCWFGGKTKTRLARRCRDSWVEFVPGAEIVEWDLAAVSRLGTPPPFFDEAIRRGRWAFAADWLRFAALAAQGGVYFDCDLELVAPIGDLFDGGEWCAGQWRRDGTVGFEPGAGLALAKNSPVARAMLAHYASASYSETLTVGERMTTALGDCPLRVLSPEVLCPIDFEGRLHRTPALRGIHHYAMAWAPPKRRLARWFNWHGMRALVACGLAVRNRLRGDADRM